MPVYHKLSAWFRNQMIGNKIMLIYIPLIVIPLLILGYASNRVYTNVMIDQTIHNVSDNSNLIITRMEGIFANVESSGNMLTINLNKLFSQNPNMSELQKYTQITNQITYTQLIFPDVSSAAFIDKDGTIYGSHPAMEDGEEDARASGLLRDINRTNGRNIWFPMQIRSFLTMDPKLPVLSMGKRIFNINTGQTLGWLILNIHEKRLSSIYQSVSSNPYGSYFIADSSGQIVSAQDKSTLLKPAADQLTRNWIRSSKNESIITGNGRGEVLLISNSFPHFDWKLITETPLRQLTKDYDKIAWLIAAMAAACLIIALFGARILSNLVVNPVKRLAKEMLKVREGSLHGSIEVNSTDEIGYLASGFNTMVYRIRELLDKVNFEQRKKREYEFALIQSQIKPHFLYNTLDVIYTLSEMGRVKDVQKTTKALADFYRVALSQGREMIAIREELDNLRDYFAIQRIRYSDVFDFEIQVHPDVLPHPIPKLTIQPLVENAIYHGLKAKGSFGTIKIHGCIENDCIHLKVMDNGVGMTEEKIRSLLSEDRSGSGSSFGLFNVNNRIKLYFGEEYGLTISSEPGQGTEICIVLPVPAKGETS
ncbi:sensor histidine kinase [Paenibacillus gansuensis]|uniref:histidine kinase n=1 Tax=Paenibacillus gansuensis TaxID=306542 RepID=A0ABW5P6N3_9BACL